MATPAITNARDGRAMIIGIISTSGGIGKNDDSIKATSASAQSAYRVRASEIVQS
ncbi:MAG: hypothetical protein O2873_10460 [Proteobacteria bacterium]|nr:hypothetical protein [Pseudomonadota bacterium]